MRRLWSTASLAALSIAAISLLAPRLMAARGPEPIALMPVAQLRPVTPGDLIPEIKVRLRSLAARSPYGDWNAVGRDHVRAWLWSYVGRAAVRLYPVTHDPELITGLLAAWRRYDEAGHDFETVDGYGWYTSERDTGFRYREVPITGMIIRPIVELLAEAKRSPELARLIKPDRARLLATVERAVAGLDSLYKEDVSGGYFMHMGRRGPEPINLMAAYVVPLLGLSELTGNADYRRQFEGVARTYKAALRRGPDGSLGWPYWARPASLTGKPDPIYKAPVTIELAVAAWRAGVVFTRDDIDQIAASLPATAIEQVDASHVRIHDGMSTGSPYMQLDIVRPRQLSVQLAGWYEIACLDPGGAALLDRLLPVLDPHYQLHTFALAGLASRLLDDAEPDRCGPHSGA